MKYSIAILLCMCSLSHAVLVRQTVRRSDGTTYTRVVEKADDYVCMTPVEQSEEIDGYYVVCRDPVAYQWALEEATILANKGSNWYNSAVVRSASYGHPKGSAPGCGTSGTGYSWSPKQPRHCALNEFPHSRIVARARVRAKDGSYFWSAHYR